MFAGCQHAVSVGNPDRIRDDAEEMMLVEDSWHEYAKTLFSMHTENWPAELIERHRKILEDKIDFPA